VAFVRVKRQGNRTYYYLVENKREGKKVRQKVIKYLGIEPPTKEQIEIMMRQRGGRNESSAIREGVN